MAEVIPDVERSRAQWRWPLVIVGLLAASYLILLLLSAGEVPRGTTVSGIDIGGLDQEAAVAAVTAGLSEQAAASMPVAIDDATALVDPAAAGMSVDYEATVAATVEPTLNPVTLVQRLVGSQQVEPVVVIDEAAMAEAMNAVAADIDREVVEGDLSFADGGVAAVEPMAGIVVDTDGAADAVADAYLADPPVAPVPLPGTVTPPEVGADEVQRALTQLGRPAVSGPVTVRTPDGAIELSPSELTPALSTTATDGRLSLELDGAALRKSAARDLARVETAAKDATFRIAGGKPVVVPAVIGSGVPADVLADAVLPVLTLTGSGRVAAVPFTDSEPDLTTAEAAALGVTEVVSTYTTRYPYAPYRLQNIHRAADLMDETVLQPGETFSLNGIVGERTAANGFAEGIIISDGRFAKDFGGGVSQVATTTYNAAFFAGLKDVEHKAHTFYISRYPAGREATVAWPSVDLRFLNDSGSGIFIDTSYTRSTVTVTMWGTKVWQIDSISSPRTNTRTPDTVYDSSDDCVPQDPVAGFDITVTRVFAKAGTEVKRESDKTRYQAADRVICREKPRPTPTASATPKPGSSPSVSPGPIVTSAPKPSVSPTG